MEKIKTNIVLSGVTKAVNMTFENGRIIIESADGIALTKQTITSIGNSKILSSRNCIECGLEFMPTTNKQIYHNANCKSRRHMRAMRSKGKFA